MLFTLCLCSVSLANYLNLIEICFYIHPQVTTAVLVFSNLGTLNTELTQALDTSISSLSKAISEALNIQTLTQVSASSETTKTRGMVFMLNVYIQN